MDGLKRRGALLLPSILAAVLLLAGCTGTPGQPDPSPTASPSPTALVVSGTVLDAVGHPVAGATVLFADSPVAVPDIAVLTDDEGRFSLAAPAPGHYELLVNAAGHGEKRIDAEAGAGKRVPLSIELPR